MRFWALALGGLAVVVMAAFGYAALSDGGDGAPRAAITAPSGDAFNATGALAEGPSRGSFSPDGRRVAVLDGNAVAIAREGGLFAFTPSDARIVDFAWMPDSNSVLLAEGPIPTGQISVLSTEGALKGTARLQPSIGFGTGYGMSVNSTGTRAAVIAVDRDVIGGREHTDLAIVELQTGVVKRFATAGEDERRPVFVDDHTVAYFESGSTTTKAQATRVVALDIESGGRTPLAAQAPRNVLGATDEGDVVVSEATAVGERVVALPPDGGTSRPLLTLRAGQRAVASDPHALRLLVATDVDVPSPSGGTNTVTRLVAVDVPQRSANGGAESG